MEGDRSASSFCGNLKILWAFHREGLAGVPRRDQGHAFVSYRLHGFFPVPKTAEVPEFQRTFNGAGGLRFPQYRRYISKLLIH